MIKLKPFLQTFTLQFIQGSGEMSWQHCFLKILNSFRKDLPGVIFASKPQIKRPLKILNNLVMVCEVPVEIIYLQDLAQISLLNF